MTVLKNFRDRSMFLGRVAWTAALVTGRHQVRDCVVCGHRTLLLDLQDNPRESFVCAVCRGASRTRHLVEVLLEIMGESADEPRPARWKFRRHADLAVFEAQASGTIHRQLTGHPRYVCSEYFDDVPPGIAGPGGIRCEDLHALSFPDEAFDLVITQDVLEHVRDPGRVTREIRRVLVPGGAMSFRFPWTRRASGRSPDWTYRGRSTGP